MTNNSKIKNLWRYLNIQDEEVLIVKMFNLSKNADDYIIARKVNGRIVVLRTDDFWKCVKDRDFRLIQYRNYEQKFDIPSPERLEHDKEIDY